MSLFDQVLVYHPEPWKDPGWKARSGVLLECVCFAVVYGTKLLGWCVENRTRSGVFLLSVRSKGMSDGNEALAKDNSESIVLC